MCAPMRPPSRTMTRAMLPGAPIAIPAYRAVASLPAHQQDAGCTYRAPGPFRARSCVERVLDAIAARVGIDRVEARRRNLIDVTDARPMSKRSVLTSRSTPAIIRSCSTRHSRP